MPSEETRFEASGTLDRPGLVGRAVRLLLGAWLILVCWTYVRYPEVFIQDGIPPLTTLLGIPIALWLIPPVVNIGWGTNWKAWPRYVSAGLLVVWILGNMLLGDSLWTPALGRFVWLLCLYTFGHLGLSFLLASAIATPGCEMRALPHLWTLLSGRATKEHFCPGFLNGLDAWERQRQGQSA